MTPVRIPFDHLPDPGARYRLAYLVSGEPDARAFSTVMNERPGVKVLNAQALGSGVLQADVTVLYVLASIGQQLGQNVFANGTGYRLTNIYMTEAGSMLDHVRAAAGGPQTGEQAGFAVSRAASTAERFIPDIAESPWTYALLAFGIGYLLLRRA